MTSSEAIKEKGEQELYDLLKKHTFIYELIKERYPKYRDKSEDDIDTILSQRVGMWSIALDNQIERERHRNLYRFH